MNARKTSDPELRTLPQVPPGTWARVVALDGLPAWQRERLQAYGLAPGRWVSVVQHSPVTVVQVEYTELAFEDELAKLVQMEM
jgi:Fe2+ transport system protein FeoA